MKTLKIFLFSLLLGGSSISNAQFVNIPDAAFVSFLQYYYPTCMSGSMMDTTCADIVNETVVDIHYSYAVTNLSGIEYFDNLNEFKMEHNHTITSIPYFPQDLLSMNIRYCSAISSVANLPSTLEVLLMDSNNLTSLPPLPAGLKDYERGHMPNLPIETALPSTLEKYSLIDCNAINLPPLPAGLLHLTIDDNVGVVIPPVLPAGLIVLRIQNLNLTSLPPMPNTLYYLHASGNNFTTLTSFPPLLVQLYLYNCASLTTVQNLPPNLQQFMAANSNLSSIDFLPNALFIIQLDNNNLSTLPNFPNQIQDAYLANNNLTSLPSVPASMDRLYLSNNSLNCIPLLPSTIWQISLDNNPFTCLPNIIPAMNATFQAYPLCVDNDLTNNPFGCSGAEGVEGYTYMDQNTNCSYQGSDLSLINVPITVYDNVGNTVSQASSFSTGRYYFHLASGQYDVVVDTVGKPYTFDCQYPGVDSTITLSSGTPLADNVDFGLTCKPGHDVGTKNIHASGFVFPGQPHTLTVKSGDMSNYYNLNCSNGVSGTVTVTVTGPVTFQNATSGSLTPAVAGNVYTYTVPDFGTVNPHTDFRLDFLTDTTALAGDLVCVNVVVTPNTGDNNLSNNNFSNCYPVVNSYDPNNKLVFPIEVEPGFDDYLTYTINFQNTGSAPAFNIRLEDTLSSFIDLSTFEVIDYSHDMHYNLTNDKLTVYFPNIMLVDSTTSEPDSKGYITYRVKSNGSVIDGDQIENTAYIFFDFNSPIVTNTIVTEVEVDDSGIDYLDQSSVGVYPNPSNQEYYIVSDKNITAVSVFDQQGKLINYSFDSNQNLVDLYDNTPGIYFMQIVLDNQTITKKLIKR